MSLPKQIHLVLDSGGYRLTVITHDDNLIGWSPANPVLPVPPEHIPNLIHSLINGELDASRINPEHQ